MAGQEQMEGVTPQLLLTLAAEFLSLTTVSGGGSGQRGALAAA